MTPLSWHAISASRLAVNLTLSIGNMGSDNERFSIQQFDSTGLEPFYPRDEVTRRATAE